MEQTKENNERIKTIRALTDEFSKEIEYISKDDVARSITVLFEEYEKNNLSGPAHDEVSEFIHTADIYLHKYSAKELAETYVEGILKERNKEEENINNSSDIR